MTVLKTRSFDPGKPGAYVANGCIGFVVPQNPFSAGEARVSGSWETSEEYNSERISSVPFPTLWSVAVDGTPLVCEASVFRDQTYDFSCGELETRLSYRLNGKDVSITDLLFCLRTHPSIVARRLIVETSDAVELRVDSAVDATRARGRYGSRNSNQRDVDWCVRWECAGELSSLGLSVLTTTDTQGFTKQKIDPSTVRLTVSLEKGARAVFTCMASLVPSTLHPEPNWQSLRLLRSAAWRGFDNLRKENQNAWQELWLSRIRLIGAEDDWQNLADSALFYLLSSSHHTAPGSIPPFGLSSSGYNGHIFWDTETFMYPVLLLADPRTAQSIIRYRTSKLVAAVNNASINGYRGAMFPWESGLSGAEVTPVFAATSEEHHVTLDIGYACLQYAWVGGDTAFIRNEIWPLLQAVCRWIESRSVATPRGREIRNVVGIDEGIDNIDNNAYTNIAAKLVLELTAQLASHLGLETNSEWSRIADEMYLPIDKDLGIITKHEGYSYQGGPCVPETLAAFFPMTYRHPDAVIEQATYDYHLSLADTVIHFPMLSSLFGVWAARRGDRKRSLEFFSKGIKEFICEPYSSFSESRGDDRPNFLTNPAGFLNACLFGLTGLQPDLGDPNTWGRYPIVMPDGWEAIEVERVWIRNRPARIFAQHGAPKVEVEWDE